jgi:hypothetical protein
MVVKNPFFFFTRGKERYWNSSVCMVGTGILFIHNLEPIMEKRMQVFTGTNVNQVVEEANDFLEHVEGNLHDVKLCESIGDYAVLLVFTPKKRTPEER